jgi:hypothetical protein
VFSKVLHGDALTMLKTLPDESVHCCVNKGRFKKGQHWRKPQPYWNYDVLYTEYVVKKRPSADIASSYGCTENNILYWLKKHGIPTRPMKQIRANKKWGLCGSDNPMYGRTGENNPRWNGGHSPERQTAYARAEWKQIARDVLKRDNYTCQQCGATHTKGIKLNVHHKKPWAKHPELRFDKENLITLCQNCHKEQHRR